MYRLSSSKKTIGVSDQRGTPEDKTQFTGSRVACVHDLVAVQAALYPSNLAIQGSGVVTYSQLDKRANRLAHHLRRSGVGPDVLVGVCLNRSAELMVAALGVLKAGGAYIPLDPNSPQERLAHMLNEAQPRVLLTDRPTAKRLPKGNWQTVRIDVDGSQIARYSMSSMESGVRPENLAYVIYTSGSTGRPKGVQIAHDSLLNLVRWHQQAFEVTASDRASQLASPGFDAAVWEVWPYLASGASIHITKDDSRSDPENLRDWLVKQRITIGFVPTPLAERLIALEWPAETALRTMLTGADTLRRYPPADLPFQLVNNYGPTECTVVATSGPVSSSDRSEILPSIGRPISHVQIYILDERMQQVPAGSAGEIFIGGAGVARGYLNAPELTESKFISNPFDANSDGRLYRTGDLARFLPDGQISFLGRIDEQIKVRGYRIEPNEVVTVLNQHPAVVSSAVVAYEGSGGDRYLAAYVVPRRDSQVTAEALESFLGERLPDYMVPSVFELIESLPVTSNGKLDRTSLPAPHPVNRIADDACIAPRSVVEQRLVDILSELLHIELVDVNANFFLLGGHSLLGAQLSSEIRETFGVQLSLRSIFASPTAAGLSLEIEKLLLAEVESMTPDQVDKALSQNRP